MARLPPSPSLPKPGLDPQRGLSMLTTRLYQVLAEVSSAVNFLYGTFLDTAVPLPTYTVATVPIASENTGSLIFVSNEVGGPTMAVSDGTNWRRMQDYAIIS